MKELIGFSNLFLGGSEMVSFASTILGANFPKEKAF
jgi:hypothetical protein